MASALQWIPDTLYNIAINWFVSSQNVDRGELRTFPENVQFDVYYKLYKTGRLCQLGCELCDLEVFTRMLRVTDKRHLLHHCFQALMDHGTRIAKILADAYLSKCHSDFAEKSSAYAEKIIRQGLSLGGFLSDAGWFAESERVLMGSLEVCRVSEDPWHLLHSLKCCLRLLHVQNAYSCFVDAEKTRKEAEYYIEKLRAHSSEPNLAGLYTESSIFYFIKCQYDNAYSWAMESLRQLVANLPIRVLVESLCQASKVCVVKREFSRAEMLIRQALALAKDGFGEQHPKYADCLMDYGFFLLNVDRINQSSEVYQAALNVRQAVFGGKNLYVALAHEDVAYSLYVREYSSGHFAAAREHAERAMSMLQLLIPENHLLMASTRRVKALILEEIAIDNQDKESEQRLLEEAEELHVSALHLSQQAFGEMNVQTAKHYGNLGRLYQSMKRFEDAERMHLKAIRIKEVLLGPHDYEVSLSVGHLASLYNYDMQHFQKAEELYLRSINIGIKLFGNSYSGLEYDYRGLLRVYSRLGEIERAAHYTYLLNLWKLLREEHAEHLPPALELEKPQPLDLFIKKVLDGN